MGQPVCVCIGREQGARLGGPGGPRRAFLSIWGASVRSGVKTALLVLWCPGRKALCVRLSAGLYSTALKMC